MRSGDKGSPQYRACSLRSTSTRRRSRAESAVFRVRAIAQPTNPLPCGKIVFTPRMRSTLDFIGFYGDFHWLPRRDSNPNKQNQNLRCYHYTTRQTRHVLFVMAGSTGLEPATPGSTVQCANQLRHNPVFRKVRILYHFLSSRARGFFKFFALGNLPEQMPISSGNFLLWSATPASNLPPIYAHQPLLGVVA